MNIIITESQYNTIVEQGKHNVTATYEVLDSKYGHDVPHEGDWPVIIDFLLKLHIGDKTYDYIFTAGGNVTEDDEWEMEEDRIDWYIIGDNNYLKSINGNEVNMHLNIDQINEVIYATDFTEIEDKISEVYHNLYN